MQHKLFECILRHYIVLIKFSFSEADGQMRVILPRQSSRQSVESTNEPPILYFDKSDSINDKLDAVFRGETPSEDPDDISVE